MISTLHHFCIAQYLFRGIKLTWRPPFQLPFPRPHFICAQRWFFRCFKWTTTKWTNNNYRMYCAMCGFIYLTWHYHAHTTHTMKFLRKIFIAFAVERDGIILLFWCICCRWNVQVEFVSDSNLQCERYLDFNHFALRKEMMSITHNNNNPTRKAIVIALADCSHHEFCLSALDEKMALCVIGIENSRKFILQSCLFYHSLCRIKLFWKLWKLWDDNYVFRMKFSAWFG